MLSKLERKSAEKEIPMNMKQMELEDDRLVVEKGRQSTLLKKKKGDDGAEDLVADFLSTTAQTVNH